MDEASGTSTTGLQTRNSQYGYRVYCYTTCVCSNDEGSAWQQCIGIARVLIALFVAMLRSIHVTWHHQLRCASLIDTMQITDCLACLEMRGCCCLR